MLNIGIIGCGHWGANYVRCFSKLKTTKVKLCCDLKIDNLQRMKEIAPLVATSQDYKDIIKDSEIKGVIVATPASSHYKLVKECLEAGKDVLAEKPLTLIPEESLDLIRIAQANDAILMVGHTFLFNPGIVKIKEYIDKGDLGRIYYINATRTHLGLIRDDVNAIWDLAPHDVCVCNYLTDSMPLAIEAVGSCYLRKDREDAAFISLVYPKNIIVHIHVSWIDSNKERIIRVVGSKARVVFNDLDNLERVKIYNKGVAVSESYNDFGEFQLNLRDGDIVSPMLNLYEPLIEMCNHFVHCINTRTKPKTDGYNGYQVVKVMKEIEEKIITNRQISDKVCR